jgi:acetyl esterase/lipase
MAISNMIATRRMLLGGAAALLAGCTRLGALNGVNALTPGDGGTDKIAADVAFGNDPRQALDVYAPENGSNLPVIVFFYGGSWSSGARGDYAFAARALAAQGFVVVVPDYRLVPQVRFPAFIEDGAGALAWTVANIGRFRGDPGRIAVSGHSAGAYIATMLALEPRWLAAHSLPPTSIKALAALAGPFDFAPFKPGGAADQAFGAAPDIAATQPISHARGDAPPMLLMTGDADETVLPRNSVALAAKITGLGGQAKVISYPGIGHIGILLAMSKPFRGKAPVVADMTAFLKATV